MAAIYLLVPVNDGSNEKTATQDFPLRQLYVTGWLL